MQYSCFQTAFGPKYEVLAASVLDDHLELVEAALKLKNDPSRRVRFELVYRRVHRSKSQNVPSTQSHRSLRDGSFLGHVPGSKLPGYYHLFPTGQMPPDPLD